MSARASQGDGSLNPKGGACPRSLSTDGSAASPGPSSPLLPRSRSKCAHRLAAWLWRSFAVLGVLVAFATTAVAPALASLTAPVIHQATTGTTEVALSWTASTGEPVKEYEVLRNSTEKAGTTDQYTTNFLDTERAPGTSYSYKIRAIGEHETTESEESSVTTAASATPLPTHGSGECPTAHLESEGHYVLEENLVVRPGHPCLEWELAKHVSLDCKGHTIEDATGTTNNEAAVALFNVEGFLVTNCRFFNQNPSPGAHNSEVLNSSSGLFEYDTFANAQSTSVELTKESTEIAYNRDVFTNALYSQYDSTGANGMSVTSGYLGFSTLTVPSQWDIYNVWMEGSQNTVDANHIVGDADYGESSEHGLYPHYVYGSDDPILLENAESHDTVVNNTLADSYDCGVEMVQPHEDSLLANNVVDNVWANGFCGYWDTGWSDDTLSHNSVAHSGSFADVAGNIGETSEHKRYGEHPENYLYGNRFEGNTFSEVRHNFWEHAVSMAGWSLQDAGHVGDNVFLNNDFTSATGTPYIEKLSPQAVSEHSGNRCKVPTATELETIENLGCTEPTEAPPAQAPQVVGVYPSQAPVAGGTSVAIEGVAFTGATKAKVYIGGVEATSVSELEDSRLIAVVPAHAAGTVNVEVETPAGRSKPPAGPPPLESTDQLSYAKLATVSSVSPFAGPGAGGTPVTITGTGFSEATAVSFGAFVEPKCEGEHPVEPCFKVMSETTITATSPSASAADVVHGFVNVTVTTPAGVSAVTEGIGLELGSSANAGFSYTDVTKVTPNTGPLAGGTRVQIVGEHFSQVRAVKFGEREINQEEGEFESARTFKVRSESEIVAWAPPAEKEETVDVTVVFRGGATVKTVADHFAYQVAPKVTKVQPSVGPETGGTAVTITGEHFANAEAVKFGEKAATKFEVKSSSEIIATSPAGSGTVNVTVTTGGGTSATSSADDFIYLPPPIVTAVQPSSGPEGGGTPVTVSGEHFESVEAVRFGTSEAVSFTVNSASSITATSPAGLGSVNVTAVTAGGTSAVSSKDQFTYNLGRLAFSFGSNSSGQLGDGKSSSEQASSSTPVQVKELGEVAGEAGGEAHSVALLENGTVKTFGSNSSDQLGDGKSSSEQASSDVPVQVCAVGEKSSCTKHLSEVKAVAAGSNHTLVLLKSGKVVAWGSNSSGQLGNGSTTNSAVPVEVKSLGEEVIAIAAGGNHSLALLKSGKVKDWGENASGQLGNGLTLSAREPVEVRSLTEAMAIGAGLKSSYAVLKSGKVKAWGENASGQLGNGSTTNSSTAVEVKKITEATAIAGGEAHALALLKTGKVDAWGADAQGQLCNEATTEAKEAVEVKNMSEASQIAAGGKHSTVLTKGGIVEGCGEDTSGQLGNGSTTNSSKLVEAKELKGASVIGAGAKHTLASGVQAPTVTSIQPNDGADAGGTSVTITGTHLVGAAAVKFGSASATSFTVNSASSITASSPAGENVVEVTVQTPGGTSALSAGDQFSYFITGPSQGLSWTAAVEEAEELTFTIPNEAGFSFTTTKVPGASGEMTKVEIDTTEPAYEEVGSQFKATSGGIQSSTEGTNKSGEHVFGPIGASCTVPSSIVLAEIPIRSSASETPKQYTASYSAECVLAPGSLNDKGTAQVTMTATGPEAVTPGQTVHLTGARFSIIAPKAWKETLIAEKTSEVKGTSTSGAVAVAVG